MNDPPFPAGRAPVLELIFDMVTRTPAVSRHARPAAWRQSALVVESGTGGGKSLVLTTAADWLSGRTPLVLIDFARCPAADPVAALAAVAESLSLPWGRYAGLRFPRLQLRLLATDPALPAGAGDERVKEHICGVLNSYRPGPRLRGLLRERAAPARAAILRPAHGGRNTPWRWGSATSPLVRRHFRAGRFGSLDDLVAVHRAAGVAPLCEAFLEDLEDAYARQPYADEWPLNCLLLADNVDTGPARDLVSAIVGARLVRQHRRRPIDPLTVVAATDGELAAEPLPGELTDADPHPDQGESLRQQIAAANGWLRYRLPGLTEMETGELIIDRPCGVDEREQVRHLVHQLTGGHVGTTRRVLEAWPAGTPFDPAAVLRERAAELLTDLAGDLPGSRPESVWLAAARVATHARWLLDDGLVDVDPKRLLSPAVTAVIWDGAPAPSMLRRLLLRRLAGTADTVSSDWVQAHSLLAETARRNRHTGLEDELYYRLAAGSAEEIELVVTSLTEQLDKLGELDWTELVESITLAPCPFPVVSAHSRRAAVFARYQPPGTGEDGPGAAVPVWQVVAGLWLLADPLTGVSRADLHHRVADAFGDLARYVDGDGEIVRGRERHHRERTKRWK